MSREEVNIEVVKGVEGNSLYVNDYRIAGPKPWGGGIIICKFTCPKREYLKAIELLESEPGPGEFTKKWRHLITGGRNEERRKLGVK